MNRTHTVQRGEFLSTIGRKYGVDWRVISRLNDGRTVRIGSTTYTFRNRPPYRIWPGLPLLIPGKAPEPAPAPSPGPAIVTPVPGGANPEPEPPVITVDPIFPPPPSFGSGDQSKYLLYGGMLVVGAGVLYTLWRFSQPKRRAPRRKRS